MKRLIVLILLFTCLPTFANNEKMFFGFGEIPILAGSFKPSLGYFHRLDQLEAGVYLQLKDELQRDQETFNTDFGQDGLFSSKEETGNRAMLQARLFLFSRLFFMSIGILSGGKDTETMVFDSRLRTLNNTEYETPISVQLEREQKLAPAFGIGVAYPLSQQWLLTSDFTMAWFGSVPKPNVILSTSAPVSNADLVWLKQTVKDKYASNFHNRRQLFNLGIEYQF